MRKLKAGDKYYDLWVNQITFNDFNILLTIIAIIYSYIYYTMYELFK